MSDESNKKKQPPKTDQVKENGETYSLYVFAGKLTDEQFEELLRILNQIAHRAGKPNSEN